ncbi:hypothetical protein PR048_008279 [Dryococelus australis]|uniref:Uncharacterized protein n=1 Tax=Dryococelus australis TaxID=614101 RepID=A0ABQ9HWZ8_9NEOP|nr:hypothetical protein PR048_008279 [Dryococelus australis]
MKQRRNARAVETGHPRENPPAIGIVRHDPTCENPGVIRSGIEHPIPYGSCVLLPGTRPVLSPLVQEENNHRGPEESRWRSRQLLASHLGEPGLIPSGVRSRIFARGNRSGQCFWSAGFLGDLPFPSPLHSDAGPYSPRFTLIGSQELGVKSHQMSPLQHSWAHSHPSHTAVAPVTQWLERLPPTKAIWVRSRVFACGNRAGRCRLQGPWVAERLDYSPPTKENRVQSPAGLLPDSLQVRVVPDDEAGRRDFIGLELKTGQVKESFADVAFMWGILLSCLQPGADAFNGCRIILVASPISLSVSGGDAVVRCAETKGWGKREIPEKTCRATASSGTTPTCETPEVARMGIEPGSPWVEGKQANRSTTAAPVKSRDSQVGN